MARNSPTGLVTRLRSSTADNTDLRDRSPVRPPYSSLAGFPRKTNHMRERALSAGHCPEASRMPRPMMILAGERQLGHPVSPNSSKTSPLGVSPIAGTVGMSARLVGWLFLKLAELGQADWGEKLFSVSRGRPVCRSISDNPAGRARGAVRSGTSDRQEVARRSSPRRRGLSGASSGRCPRCRG